MTADSLLRQTADRLFGQHVTQAVRLAAERGVFPEAAWNAVEAAGLTRAMVPEHAGGYGMALPEALGLLVEAGRHAVPLPLAETMQAAWLLAGAGLDIPDGVLTLACDEAVTLARDGASWRLAGTAAQVPWGRDAGHVAVLAGGRLALVPRAGFTAEPGENLAGEPRDTLRLDATLTDGQVAEAAPGITPAGLRAVGAAMRSLQIAGALAAVVTMTTEYAQQRTQFGRPIGRFQAIQHSVAVLAAQAAAAAAAADGATEAVAAGIAVLPIAAAKIRAGEAAGIAAGIAHQVHGAIGFTQEHPLHVFTKRLWSWRDEHGSEAEWSLKLGRHMAAAGADRLWAEITSL